MPATTSAAVRALPYARCRTPPEEPLAVVGDYTQLGATEVPRRGARYRQPAPGARALKDITSSTDSIRTR
jgi:hypothetical protein